MRIKLSKSDWRKVGHKMGWLKKALIMISWTKEEFLNTTSAEKKDTARNHPMLPETQQLFFTEDYQRKDDILRNLAQSAFLSPETQQMFFKKNYKGKKDVLMDLARNPKLSQGTQMMFFEMKYENKDRILKVLDKNENL